ncbi:MAG: DUF4176 domain-containing protein [Lachnospiraceae bacterium]|nr:DUF4176 domain-containing protein [Lachnospiraceae bacterium]
MENKLDKELLPIGSVVQLEGGTKKIMVIGLFPFDMNKQDKVYDYMGVLYPEGYLGKESACMFNHDKIAQVYFRGFEDEEREKFLDVVQQVYDSAEKTIREQAN